MKIKFRTMCLLLLLPLLYPVVETRAETSWTRIVSPSKNWSVAVPDGFLVESRKKDHTIYIRSKNLSGRIFMDTHKNAKNRFKFKFSFMNRNELGKFKFFEIGEFIGSLNTTTHDDPKRKNYAIDFAANRGLNSVSISSSDVNNNDVQRLLQSITLGNKGLFNGNSASSVSRKTISVTSLQTSPTIREALARKDSKQRTLVKTSHDVSTDSGQADNYDGSFLIVRKARANFTNGARLRKVSGVVKLRVEFLATGMIGEIRLASSLDRGLDNSAFEAAKKIKFLPETINGKAVTIVKFIQYSFTVY